MAHILQCRPQDSLVDGFPSGTNYGSVIAIPLCHLKLHLSPLSCIYSGSYLLSNSTLCIVSSSWAPIVLPPLHCSVSYTVPISSLKLHDHVNSGGSRICEGSQNGQNTFADTLKVHRFLQLLSKCCIM